MSTGPDILPAFRLAITANPSVISPVGVTLIKNACVVTVAPSDAGTESVASRVTLKLSDGKTLEADLYIPANGTRPNTSFVSNTILTDDDRINTNDSTLRVDKACPRFYAVGDVALYAHPAIHLILDAIPVFGTNIKRDLLLASGGEGSSVEVDRSFKEDTLETQMAPIGKSKRVSTAMGYQLPKGYGRLGASGVVSSGQRNHEARRSSSISPQDAIVMIFVRYRASSLQVP